MTTKPETTCTILRDTLIRHGYTDAFEFDSSLFPTVIVPTGSDTEVHFMSSSMNPRSFTGWVAIERRCMSHITFIDREDDVVYDNQTHETLSDIGHDSMLAAQALTAFIAGRTR